MSNADKLKVLAGASGVGGASLVEVANSALFDSANSEYLSKTLSASDTTEWLFSTWIDFADYSPSGWKVFFSASVEDYIMMNTDTSLRFNLGNTTANRLETTQLFRDLGYGNLVCTFHSDDATAGDRMQMFWNGVQITAFDVSNDPISGYTSDINAAKSHSIGRADATNDQFFDGYMSETVFLDGQSIQGGGVAITDFGEFSTDGLYWTPKSSTDIKALTFGTNGFYLGNTMSPEIDESGSNITEKQIADGAGTVFGDMTNATASNHITNAFDGVTVSADGANSASKRTSVTEGYIGKDWGEGVTRTITRLDVWDVNNAGYADSTVAVVFKVYGSNTSPSSHSDGTLLYTSASAASTVASQPRSFTSGFDESTAYRYHWVVNQPASTVTNLRFGEIRFFANSGNDFTNNNTVVTSTHTPTNIFGLWNPIDRHDNVTLSNGNRTETHSTGDRPVFTGTLPPNTKGYIEVEATTFVSGDWIGVCNNEFVQGVDIAGSSDCWVYKPSTGYKSNGNGDPGVSYGGALVAGEIIGIAWDLTLGDGSNKIWIRNDGTWENSGDPAAGTGEMYATLPDQVRIVQGSRSASAGAFTINPGVEAFGSTAPTGFMDGWSTTELAAATTRTVSDPYEHWNNVLWADTGATQSISGVGFQPDFLWSKKRTGSGNLAGGMSDIVRGVGNILLTHLTNAESATAYHDSFDSDGFTKGSWWDNASDPIVTWAAKLGGTAASNPDGSITSSVSANTTLGMSVGTYTGTGTTATIGHGLGVAPEFIIVKHTDGADSWTCYHVGTNATAPEDKYLNLNATTAVVDDVMWNDTAPTSSVFTVYGGYSRVNASTEEYMFIAFAPSEFISIGSYEGNGNADGTFVTTLNSVGVPLMPIFHLAKNIDFADSWNMMDAARDTSNLTDHMLIPNSSAAETTGGGRKVDFVSSGVKQRGSDTALNSAHTFIHLTIGIPTIDVDGRLLAAR